MKEGNEEHMLKQKTVVRYWLVALAAVTVASPLLAQASTCVGQKVNWGVASTTQWVGCKGASVGSFSLFPDGTQFASALSVRLDSGIHASGIAYAPSGGVMSGCNPFDDSTADGWKTVKIPCIGGAKHQVIVAGLF